MYAFRKTPVAFRQRSSLWRPLTECYRRFFYNFLSLPSSHGNCRSTCRHRTKFFELHYTPFTLNRFIHVLVDSEYDHRFDTNRFKVVFPSLPYYDTSFMYRYVYIRYTLFVPFCMCLILVAPTCSKTIRWTSGGHKQPSLLAI